MGKFTKDRRVQKDLNYSKKDIYYRKAKEDQFRARSAYKLLQIDEIFQIFKEAQRAIDLCAAPGSWSQVIQKCFSKKGLFNQPGPVRIVSVDLQEMAPIENITQIQGDITKKSTVDSVLQAFDYQRAELVVSDGAPDVTGFHDIDQYIQSQLIVATLNICLMCLQPGGVFVAKIFKGSDVKLLYSMFKVFFNSVYFYKPKSSRESSVENFIVCLQYDPPFRVERLKLYTFKNEQERQKQEEEQKQQQTESKQDQLQQQQIQLPEMASREMDKYFKFLTCGDLSGFDEIDL